MESQTPVLKTERCILRLPSEKDVPALVQFQNENRDHFAPWEPTQTPESFTEPYWRTKVIDAHKEFQEGKTLRFHLFLKDDQTLIGMVNFSRMTRGVFQCCGLGYRIGKAHEGKGFMSECLKAAIDHMFHTSHFHRIEANHLPNNTRSEKILRRLGFEREGYAKNYLRIAGKWQDHVLNSLTHHGWKEI